MIESGVKPGVINVDKKVKDVKVDRAYNTACQHVFFLMLRFLKIFEKNAFLIYFFEISKYELQFSWQTESHCYFHFNYRGREDLDKMLLPIDLIV